MNSAWRISECNFTEDDGSLPGVDFVGLTPESARSITDYFFRVGRLTGNNATLWNNKSKQDVNLSGISDPAGLVTCGAADPFYCCFSGISWDQVELPVLGLFVFQESLEIDYRMGCEWNPDRVEAFFRLVAHLISIAPEAIVASTEQEGLPFPERFDEALDHYSPQRKKKSEQGVESNR